MITGYFKEVSVPEVAVGQDIKATIDFYALNPGALYWKTFLIVDSPGLGIQRELDAAREIGQEGGRRKTYNLGKMPAKQVAISFFIFAHDDAGYDWDWGEYRAWLDGFTGKVTHLASEYKFISPGAAPPPEMETLEVRIDPSEAGHVTTNPAGYNWQFPYGTTVYVTAHPNPGYVFKSWSGEMKDTTAITAPVYPMTEHRKITAHFKLKEIPEPPEPEKYSGAITGVTPSQIKAGDALNLYVTFEARTVSAWEASTGWHTDIVVELDSFSGSDTQRHIGYEGGRTLQEIRLGTMPNRSLSGRVTLSGNGQVLDTKIIAVTAKGLVPPAKCSIDADCLPGYVCRDGVCVKEEEIPPIPPTPIPWTWVAVAVAALLLLPKEKPKKRVKKK